MKFVDYWATPAAQGAYGKATGAASIYQAGTGKHLAYAFQNFDYLQQGLLGDSFNDAGSKYPPLVHIVGGRLRDAQHARRAAHADAQQAVETPCDQRRVELRVHEAAQTVHREHLGARGDWRRRERRVQDVDAVAHALGQGFAAPM